MDNEFQRYIEICRENPLWKRQKADKIAKEMDLIFLYKYGYDYASTLVHPMANDGEADFFRQTNMAPKEIFTDQSIVIKNSCLIVAVLIQEGLNISDFLWRGIVFDFLEKFINFLHSGSREYILIFYKIDKLVPETDLCKKKDQK